MVLSLFLKLSVEIFSAVILFYSSRLSAGFFCFLFFFFSASVSLLNFMFW